MPVPDAVLGPLAALTTSLFWTFTSIFFTAAARRIGASAVNNARIVLAVSVHLLVFRFLTGDGRWIPAVDARQTLLLALSGLVGLTIGDLALFSAFVRIGPRLANLVMTSAPVFALLLGWTVLGERVPLAALGGIALVLGGIAWVVRERPRAIRGATDPRARRVGIVLALVGALCQGGGLLLSKAGMGHGWLPEEQHLAPQAATLVRMAFAGLGIVPVTLAMRLIAAGGAGGGAPPRIGTRRAGYAFMAAGAVFGPVFGVWLSLVAADRAPVGVAQTLLSLTPVLILPYAHFVEGERVTVRSILGALLAVAGVAVLFVASG